MAIQGIALKLDTSEASAAQKNFEASTKSTFDEIAKQGDLLNTLQKKFIDAATAQEQATAAQAKFTEQTKKAAAEAKAAADAVHPALAGQTINPVFGGRSPSAWKEDQARADAIVAAQKKQSESTKVLAADLGDLGTKSTQTVGFMQKLLGATGNSGAARGVGILATGVRGLAAAINPIGLITGAAAAAIISWGVQVVTAQSDTAKWADSLSASAAGMNLLIESTNRSGQALSSLAEARRSFEVAGSDEKADRAVDLMKRQTEAIRTLKREQQKSPHADIFLGVDQLKALGEALDLDAKGMQKIQEFASLKGVSHFSAEFRDLEKALQDFGLQVSWTTDGRGLMGALFGDGSVNGIDGRDAIAAIEKAMEKQKDALQKLIDQKKIEAKAQADVNAEVDAYKALASDLSAMRDETEVLNTQVEARTKLRLSMEMEAKVRKAGGLITDEDRRLIDETVASLANATEAEKKRVGAMEATMESENRRAELLRQTNEEEIAAYKKKLQEVEQVGGDAFGAIGRGIADAINNGGSLRSLIQGVAQDLARLAEQKFIIEALARFGAYAAGSLFGGSQPGAPSGNNIGPTDPNGHFAYGGYLPSRDGPTMFSSMGRVLNDYQTFSYNGRSITTNEGGSATPEAIVPLSRDQHGRLGVQMAGAGSSYTIVMPNVKSAEEARRIRPTMRQALDSIERGAGRRRNGLRAGR